MSMPGVCGACHRTMPVEATACPHCGNVPGGGINPMGLMLWFLLIFTIPIYPIAGSGALLGALAVAALGLIPGFPPLLVLLLLLIVPVIGFFVAFKYERLAAFSRIYRIARYVLRWATGFAAIYFAIFGEFGISGGEMFGVIVLVPLAILVTKFADIAFDARGPIPPEKPMGRFKKLMYDLKWNEALIIGFPFGVLGFLMGQDTRILFGLFAWAFVTVAILGVKLLFLMLGAGLHLAGKANRGLGGVPSRIFWGAGLGAGAGAALGQMLDGRVQVEAVIIGSILGLIVSLIMGAVRKRPVNN